MPASSPASPNETNAVDPTIAGAGLMSASAGSDDGNENDGRKGYGRRELSTSKRAAQNRAAQVCLFFVDPVFLSVLDARQSQGSVSQLPRWSIVILGPIDLCLATCFYPPPVPYLSNHRDRIRQLTMVPLASL